MTIIQLKSNLSISINTFLCSFCPKDDTVTESNMAVLEVSMPSGFTAETDSLLTLTEIKNVKKVETKDSETVIVIYFDNLEANKMVCPLFDGYQVYKVADQKPASVVIYDYYDSCKCGNHDW